MKLLLGYGTGRWMKLGGQHPGETTLTNKEQEEWMSGPRGLQITHRGDAVTFTLFFTVRRRSRPGLTLQAPPWRHQTLCERWFAVLVKRPCRRELVPAPRLCCILLHSCFTWCRRTQARLYFPSEACDSLPLAVTPNLSAAWLLHPLPSPPLPSPLAPCLSEGRQQVFCDSKIREPLRDGAPLSSAACEEEEEEEEEERKSTLPFSESVLSLQKKTAFIPPPPGPQAHRFNTSVCVLSALRARVCLPQAPARSFFIKEHVSYMLPSGGVAGEEELGIKEEEQKHSGSTRCAEDACATPKRGSDFAAIKSDLFAVTQFTSTLLSDLKLVSVMLTQTLHYRPPLSSSREQFCELHFIRLHAAAAESPVAMTGTLLMPEPHVHRPPFPSTAHFVSVKAACNLRASSV